MNSNSNHVICLDGWQQLQKENRSVFNGTTIAVATENQFVMQWEDIGRLWLNMVSICSCCITPTLFYYGPSVINNQSKICNL